jgi:peptidyl-prolyl cis-trans isomerase C
MNPAALMPPLIVDGAVIPAADIAAEAQHHAAPAGKPGLAWRAAARALAVRALLLAEADRADIAATPQPMGEGRRETPEEARIRALIEARVAVPPATEAACRAAYDAAPDGFRSPDLFEPAHILFAAAPDDLAARAEAKARAEAALTLLADNPAAFGRIAASESACSSAKTGGSMGQIASGDTVPEFEAALVALAPGQIAQSPVETRYGLHIVRLDARAPGARLPYETVRPRIAEALERRAWAKAANAFVADLLAGAEISGVDFPAPPAEQRTDH